MSERDDSPDSFSSIPGFDADDTHDDIYDDIASDVEPAAVAVAERKPAHAAQPTDTITRKSLRGIGEVLVTLGVVVLLFIVYEAFITDIFTAQKQAELREQLEEEWNDPTIEQQTSFADLPLGEAFAVLRIPAFGADYAQVVVEGTTPAVLETGPGHYSSTAGIGEVGNFSIAGHRVGKGSPFLNLDKLTPGDAIVFETQDLWYIYRVIGDEASGSFSDPAYPGIEGQFITVPSDYDVIAPVPGDSSAVPTDRLLTFTTCHPKFSAAERLIIHGYLDGDPLPKSAYPTPADVPALNGG